MVNLIVREVNLYAVDFVRHLVTLSVVLFSMEWTVLRRLFKISDLNVQVTCGLVIRPANESFYVGFISCSDSRKKFTTFPLGIVRDNILTNGSSILW